MTPRAIVLILDGLGVGDLPDSREFGDTGRNTLANLAAAVGGVSLPALEGLGLGRVQPFAGMDAARGVRGAYGRMAEKSRGKDSTTGHWELAGLVLEQPFPLFPDGFPAAILAELGRRSGYGFIGNEAASGTEIIERLGDEHRESGKLILYTSADSVLQVAAHEQVVPLADLYAFCRLARDVMQGEFGVSRIIARPFVGASGGYERSLGRRDFSLPPPGETLLDRLLAAELPVTGIGKVVDLFADRGFSHRVESKSNAQGMAQLRELQAKPAEPGLLLINLVDFDMLWGHRRDPAGYAGGLREFDAFLAEFLGALQPQDRLFITADHGNDPTGPGSDHTREYVPLLAYRPGMTGAIDLGRRQGFGDLAETLAEAFALAPFGVGRSFWSELEEDSMQPSQHDNEALVSAALEARDGAHAPYSGFRVGAALRGADGRVLAAANLENASLGLSVCAERNLVARAVFEGCRDWSRLAIATDAEDFTPPCGACLQVLREFVADLDILLVNAAGESQLRRLADFLPNPFTDFPRESVNLLPLILAKRGGRALTAAQIEDFVAAVSTGAAPDYQISALLMAIFCRGMERDETSALTQAMADSGETHDWSALRAPTVDKHSTGGVGDKLSLIIAPLVASLGAAVPMLSGRGLGFTGGTLDKLESIPGFRTRLSNDEFRVQVEQLGCAFIGQSDGIAPADRKLYALRDVTGTVESLPLIVSSILSKKLAAGPTGLVIDLKVGRGAFMKDIAQARALGRALRETATAFGRRCSVLYTRMDAPLGRSVGNAPEVRESLAALRGEGPAEIRELALALAAEMLALAGLGVRRELVRRCERALDDGSALECFLAVVHRQGGALRAEREDFGLPAAAVTRVLEAPSAGHLAAPDAERIGRLCVGLGAGRERAEDAVDPCAGLVFLKSWGEALVAGEPWVRIEASDAARVERAAVELESLLAVTSKAPSVRTSLLTALEDAAGERPLGGLDDYSDLD